jgi:hypothetical protein
MTHTHTHTHTLESIKVYGKCTTIVYSDAKRKIIMSLAQDKNVCNYSVALIFLVLLFFYEIVIVPL